MITWTTPVFWYWIFIIARLFCSHPCVPWALRSDISVYWLLADVNCLLSVSCPSLDVPSEQSMNTLLSWVKVTWIFPFLESLRYWVMGCAYLSFLMRTQRAWSWWPSAEVVWWCSSWQSSGILSATAEVRSNATVNHDKKAQVQSSLLQTGPCYSWIWFAWILHLFSWLLLICRQRRQDLRAVKQRNEALAAKLRTQQTDRDFHKYGHCVLCLFFFLLHVMKHKGVCLDM